ncbi:hypothetical protein DE146DRAFT_649901 [Phaeosphaeria sp. MPI-PUGE-AT-0046c]|nr:hypothetical protein DE146DRAFT_649901 [Phaeosphaeria sp. MPI-PUGE-AT-0046c]
MATQLSTELARIIQSPYPASLSHLADLLARADVLTIRACVYDRSPCAISRLATLVCEALPLWAHTLRVLASLCQSPEFVDTLLWQNPGLLDALVTKANSSPRDYDEYAGVCVLLLSRPLPASIPLPASAQPFFLRVFERARQDPTVNTLKPLYSMLNGACRNLLSLLSVEKREQFDQVLSRILSSNGAGQDYMLMLWCFGIVLLVEHASDIGPPQSPLSSIELPIATIGRRWRTAAGHKMFGSTEKVYKTINLTYLSVIVATKGDIGVSDGDAVEGIRIAICTLRCVDGSDLKAWPKSSALAKGTFSKLPLKIMRLDIDPAVQIEALCFYSMVAGQGNLPTEIVTQYERCLLRATDLANAECLGETLLISLPLFSPQMQQQSIHKLLAGILDTCLFPLHSHQTSIHTSLVERIATTLPSCESLQGHVLGAVTHGEIQDKIWKVLQLNMESDDTDCQAYATSLQQNLRSATIALLLTLALKSAGPVLPTRLSNALVSKQRQFRRGGFHCLHKAATVETTKISLFQQNNTPYTGQHLHNWRDRLKIDLESHGSYQRDSIMRSVAQICQDLEVRCNTVEEPLHREKEKTQKLEQHIIRLQQRLELLEVQAADDRLYSEGLEDEKMSIAKERESLSNRLSDVEANFHEAIRKSDDDMCQAREEYHAKEVELRSTILTYEETIRMHESDRMAQDSEMTSLRQTLGQLQQEHTTLEKELDTVRVKLGNVGQDLASELETIRAQSEEIKRLKDRNIELELQLQGTEADLDTTTSKLGDLQVSHRALVLSSEEAYKDLEHKYNRDMEATATTAKHANDDLNTKFHEAIQHNLVVESAHEETRQLLRKSEAEVPIYEQRIQELTEFCSEQEEELEELRTLRKNVLASMGLGSQNLLAIRSVPRDQKDTSEARTPRTHREHRRRKSALQTVVDVPRASEDGHGATSTATEHVANASSGSSDSQSSQNGPTPKRSKPRPVFKIPTMQTPYTQKPLLTSRSVSKKLSPIKRSALRQLSPNRRHTTVGFVASEDEDGPPDTMRSTKKRRGSLQDIEQADSAMEDFLAGTPLTPGNFMTGTGRVPEDEETTTTEL